MTQSNKKQKAELFTLQMLPQVSRTFSLAIRFLPKNLGRPVGLAYLFCRIADTFEDSEVLPVSQRQDMLYKFADLLKTGESKYINELKSAFQGKTIDGSADHKPSIKLVENLDQVLTAADSLSAISREHIYFRVQEMSLGMAEYTAIPSGSQNDVSFLKDESDWDRYCYYVAGTVGHMLTDLFADYAGFSDPVREKLHPLGRSFGLGLQKVNILKDAVVDTKRGICFLPKTLIDRFGIDFASQSTGKLKGDIRGLVINVIDICHRHFQDSLEYIEYIPRKYPGLRMFLIVPVMLAAGTMRLFADSPQILGEKGDLKLTHKDVWKLVRRSNYCKFSNRFLHHSFGKIYPVVDQTV